ncbi:DUF1206 domain-containing protein [Nibribacter ruber]|uniref:DUF1206 domain-containing protein n=1 Tax=Nibribacter ruber TaxID=2698458 RepID=A0A6P1NXZ9_9BACT|nr:DUF1206 domain-containing protein [Nibribacter ruber]QHL86795.1 DUF1206 domain-containing protein [Nibribacter ruber]
MQQQKKDWIIKYARVGYVAKGIVYCLIGILTAMYALGIGGEKASKTDAFMEVKELPGGSFLLGLIAAGLIGYSLWRFTQAIADTENKGTDFKGIGKRLAYAFSGLIYGSFAFVAFKIATNTGGGSSNGSSQKTFLAELLDKPFGKYLAIIIGLITIGNGLLQLKRVITGSFMKDVHGMPQDQFRILERAGKIGYAARGVVFGILGYLFAKAAWNRNPSQAQDTEGVFGFLRDNPMGDFLLAAVAIGLVGYGIFMFVRARYSEISFN